MSPILQVAGAGGDAALYDRYLARLTAATAMPEEYYRFFNTLAAFHAPELVARTLRFALSSDVRSQDAPLLIAQMLGSQQTQDATWAFVQAEWPALVARLGTFQGIPNIVGSFSGFCSMEKADEIRTFFTTHRVPEAARSLQQSLERIEACAAIRSRQSPAFGKWLASRQ